MILPKGSILKVASVALPNTKFSLSEHNRGEVSFEVERIEKSDRMVNGRMRKWFVADKRSWSATWDSLPHDAANTIDNFWGGSEIETWYINNPGEFYLYVRTPTGSETQYLVMFKDFSKSVQKRGIFEMWTVSLTLEEV